MRLGVSRECVRLSVRACAGMRICVCASEESHKSVCVCVLLLLLEASTR